MSTAVSDGQLVEAMKALKEQGSFVKAARHLGTTKDVVEYRVNTGKAKGFTHLTVIRDPLEAAKVELRRVKQELNNVLKHNESAETIRKEIWQLEAIEPEPPKWVLDQKAGRKARAGIPFCHWSDWHYGEVVTGSGTAGANEFTRAIARRRVRTLVESSIRLARGFSFREDQTGPAGIVVAINGDLISGDIHEELRETNEVPPFVCVEDVLGLLVWAINQLKEQFGKVFVPCTIGNHGRTTHKPRMKDRVYLSYEWNLYQSLRRYYQNDPKVRVMVADNADLLYRVNGQRFLQTHGDALGVKGGDGIIGALGPIARGAVKIRNSEFKIGRDFDYLIMGHWHQDLWIGRTFVNGALKGYDEYARLVLRAEPGRPSQQLWFVHPEQGVTARIPVYVDEGEKARVNKQEPKWAEVAV